MSVKSSSAGKDSLSLLKKGNARYVCGKTEGPNRAEERRIYTYENGQSPMAILVSCADSRVAPELLFDRGVGDLFTIRVAGNICGFSEMGSIEYAVEHLHIPLLIIMAHSCCGAVTAVVDEAEVEGNLLTIAERIAPAVKRTKEARPALTGADLVDECAKGNVWYQVETLIKECSVVRNALANETLQIEGAFYDIHHGDVTWLGKHPEEKELITQAQ
ncbi:carbonic anhydrase [Thermodesulfobacteriota bacterium]